ncbi:hypothetical protein ACIBCU_37935 [Streptomyces sp. NPDC051064]|uniref:hypothetical protein n=1 Tax=Streptomyces sp. NPDC051064 TaxID=3365641 RepID=UPI0037BB391F
MRGAGACGKQVVGRDHPAAYPVLRRAWQACSLPLLLVVVTVQTAVARAYLAHRHPGAIQAPAFTVVVTAIDTMRAGKPPVHRSARPRRASPRPLRDGHQHRPSPPEVHDVLSPCRQLLPQVLRLGLGQEAAVLGLGDGQGVLVPYTLQFGP